MRRCCSSTPSASATASGTRSATPTPRSGWSCSTCRSPLSSTSRAWTCSPRSTTSWAPGGWRCGWPGSAPACWRCWSAAAWPTPSAAPTCTGASRTRPVTSQPDGRSGSGHDRSLWPGDLRRVREPPDLDQLQAEGLDLVQQPVQGRLVLDRAVDHRLHRFHRRPHALEGGHQRVAQASPDADLVAGFLMRHAHPPRRAVRRLSPMVPSPGVTARHPNGVIHPARVRTAHPRRPASSARRQPKGVVMGAAIGDVLGLAAGVAVSPLPIVAMILVLATPRGRVNGSLFGIGWLAGLSILGTVVLLLAGPADPSDDGTPAAWTGWLKLLLGVLALLLAARQWRGRRPPGGGPRPPSPGPGWPAGSRPSPWPCSW